MLFFHVVNILKINEKEIPGEKNSRVNCVARGATPLREPNFIISFILTVKYIKSIKSSVRVERHSLS